MNDWEKRMIDLERMRLTTFRMIGWGTIFLLIAILWMFEYKYDPETGGRLSYPTSAILLYCMYRAMKKVRIDDVD